MKSATLSPIFTSELPPDVHLHVADPVSPSELSESDHGDVALAFNTLFNKVMLDNNEDTRAIITPVTGVRHSFNASGQLVTEIDEAARTDNKPVARAELVLNKTFHDKDNNPSHWLVTLESREEPRQAGIFAPDAHDRVLDFRGVAGFGGKIVRYKVLKDTEERFEQPPAPIVKEIKLERLINGLRREEYIYRLGSDGVVRCIDDFESWKSRPHPPDPSYRVPYVIDISSIKEFVNVESPETPADERGRVVGWDEIVSLNDNMLKTTVSVVA